MESETGKLSAESHCNLINCLPNPDGISENTIFTDNKTYTIIPHEIYNVRLKLEKTELAKILEQKDKKLNFGLTQKVSTDAGYDVKACIEGPYVLAPNKRILIPTGLKVELSSPHYEIQCRPRSGIAVKHGIIICNTPGTIDYGYRDEIKVILLNTDKDHSFIINPGDRIAQLCIREIPMVKIEYVDKISREEDRGGGFGSSGV